MNYLIFFLLNVLLLIFVACGSNSSDSKSDASPQVIAGMSQASSINDVLESDLSSDKATLEAIDNIPNIIKVNALWLENEWVSYDATGKLSNEKYTFFENGSYKHETVYSENIKKTFGTWVIYENENNRKMLFLSANDKFSIHAVEREGNNAFRLIPQFSNLLLRSKLYTRLSSDEAVIYPGMFFLGTFTHNTYLNSLYKEYRYTFTKDFKVKRTIESKGSNGKSLDITTDNGAWSVNTNNTILTLSFNGTTETYNLGNSSADSIVLIKNEEELYLRKVNEPSLKHIDNLVGEYQSPRDDNYISIRKESNKYFVDILFNYSSSDRYYNIEATKTEKDVLSFTIPHRENNYNIHEGDKVSIRSGHNRLVFLEYPFYASATTYEKVSKYPMVKKPTLLGGWKSTIFSASNYMISKYFLEDGLYLYYNDRGLYYGKYTQEDDKLILKETCKEPQVLNLTSEGKYLKLNTINYTPHIGLRGWKEEGLKLGKIYNKHVYDSYQKEKSPKLIPHPKYKGTYLFKEKIKFSDGLSTFFGFNSDGTGYISSTFSGTNYTYSGYWISNYRHGQLLGLKYFIFLEDGREYISYYYDGAFTNYSENYYSPTNGWTVGRVEEDIKDVKIVELYHRRTAVCRQTDGTYDVNKGGSIMPLVK